MPPIISLVGKPGGGKTTLLESLIPFLVAQGFRVGTIKHHVHNFTMDTPGKDTWRHKEAGACVVALASPSGLGVIRDVDGDPSVEEVTARYFYDVDLVITEGYKRLSFPKIEVFRSSVHTAPLPERDHTWVALVSDLPFGDDLPCFRPEDIAGLAAFIVERYLRPPAGPQLLLLADGRPVPLSPSSAATVLADLMRLPEVLEQGLSPCEISLLINHARQQK